MSMNTVNEKEKLKLLIQERMEERETFVVAIDGMSGSGKSTLGNWLHEEFPESNLFHMDDYFLRPEQRTMERLNEIGGNVDYARFKEEVLDHVREKRGLSYARYDCKTRTLLDKKMVEWKPLVIIEGSYSQHPYFGEAYDLRVFCEVSEEEQRQRILKRNGEQQLSRFLEEWIPKENAYFDRYKIKDKRDC